MMRSTIVGADMAPGHRPGELRISGRSGEGGTLNQRSGELASNLEPQCHFCKIPCFFPC
jgi:hypothetical protein